MIEGLNRKRYCCDGERCRLASQANGGGFSAETKSGELDGYMAGGGRDTDLPGSGLSPCEMKAIVFYLFLMNENMQCFKLSQDK